MTTVRATIEAICSFASPDRGDPVTTEYFHLHPCGGCGAPMWQQPCQLCRFYPMGRATDEEVARCKRLVPDPRASFTKAIERNGSIAVWFIRSWRNSVAWRDDSVFLRQLEELEVRAAEIPCADGGEIYDEIVTAWRAKWERS